MISLLLPPDVARDEFLLRQHLANSGIDTPRWVLAYADEQTPTKPLLNYMKREHPHVPVVGCTSFQGVFTREGFARGVGLLVGEQADGVEFVSRLVSCSSKTAKSRAAEASAELRDELGQLPDIVLIHPSPGFEEELLEGIEQIFGSKVPVFGGSAADDTVGGRWRIFDGGRVERSGMVIAALKASTPPRGGFVGGYLPSEHTATVTRCDGRTIYELGGQPAAELYNEWTHGAIEGQLKTGGGILQQSNLLPLAREIPQAGRLPRRLLSHPERVLAPSGALTFFSRFTEGETVRLMTNTTTGLIPRVRRVTTHALPHRVNNTQRPVCGGLLVYCAGCLSSTLDSASQIPKEFMAVAGEVPFVGVSTFGEQGSFFARGQNYHGNLMCSAVLFSR